jgi:hypothetical protein
LFRLIKKILLFILISIVFLGPFCYLSQQSMHKTLSSPIFHFNENITILIAGDSHAEVSINPSFLSHSENIAQSCENYFYTYYKLRHFLDRNPQISTIALAFSWHNFARDYQESILYGDVGKNIEYFFPLIDRSGKELIESWKSSYLVPWGRYTMGFPLQIYRNLLLQKQLLKIPLKREDFNFFGEYQSLSTSNIDQENIDKKIKLYFNGLHLTDYSMSKYMIEYLYKILELCSQRKIKIVLFNSPVNSIYHNGVPVRAFHDLDSLQIKLRSQFDNVVYFDNSNMQLPSEYYYDGDHVNSMGSIVFTKYFANELAKLSL